MIADIFAGQSREAMRLWADWLKQLGEGTLPPSQGMGGEWISVPEQIVLPNDGGGENALISHVWKRYLDFFAEPGAFGDEEDEVSLHFCTPINDLHC